MASFTVRIELHNATAGDYERLHVAAATRGLLRIVTADTGTRYYLPPAEYNYQGTDEIASVLNRAKLTIAQIGKTGAVLVTESIRRTWDGLQQAP